MTDNEGNFERALNDHVEKLSYRLEQVEAFFDGQIDDLGKIDRIYEIINELRKEVFSLTNRKFSEQELLIHLRRIIEDYNCSKNKRKWWRFWE